MTDVVKIIGREEHQRGFEEGREEALVETARKLLAGGMDVELVAQFTGLDRTLLERLLSER